MGHQVPNLIGVPQKDLAKRIGKLVPDYMAMGSSGGSMGDMEMPLPDNTLPMMTGTGPFGVLEMGGMFTVVKVREGLGRKDYRDPGWFKHPEGNVAYEYTGELPDGRFRGEPDGIPADICYFNCGKNVMKKAIALILMGCAVAVSATAYAAGDTADTNMPSGAQPGAEEKSSMSHGEVKKVDTAAGKLTIKHGPLENLDMEAMTMVFKVRGPAMLSELRQC